MPSSGNLSFTPVLPCHVSRGGALRSPSCSTATCFCLWATLLSSIWSCGTGRQAYPHYPHWMNAAKFRQRAGCLALAEAAEAACGSGTAICLSAVAARATNNGTSAFSWLSRCSLPLQQVPTASSTPEIPEGATRGHTVHGSASLAPAAAHTST